MDARKYVENAIARLEKQLGLPVTIVDYDGWFNDRQKSRVFDENRKSHRKLPLCDMGFCKKCRDNCRRRINALCMAEPHAHYTVCWKNLGQIAVPLRHQNFHYGVFYGGLFRAADGVVPEGLPADFYTLYKKLPLYDHDMVNEYMAVLDIFARGLINYLCEENILNFNYDTRTRQLVEYLEKHYSEAVSLEDAAGVLGLTPAYASSFIKKSSGYSFSQLLRSIRIEQAKKLLTASGENLHSIAMKCGFANEFHFSKVFRQQIGESPAVFRKRNEPQKDQ